MLFPSVFIIYIIVLLQQNKVDYVKYKCFVNNKTVSCASTFIISTLREK